MGVVIAGFLGGAAKGMADAGQMMLADSLAKERDEASFLRDSEFRRNERLSGQEFDAGESALNRSSAEGIAATKAAATLKDNRTSQMKNIEDLMKSKGLSFQAALRRVYPGATVKHTDVEGNLSVAVIDVETGRMMNISTFMLNDAGTPEFVQPGEKTTKTKPTKKDREEAAAEIDKESGADSDRIPFNSTNPNSDEARKRAQDKIDAGDAGTGKPGIRLRV